MYKLAFFGLLLAAFVTNSSQHVCEECDCNISGGDAKGVHVTKLTCKDGIVTWYNPVGALRLELQPKFSARFKACFVVDSGSVRLKVSQEVDARREPKSPSDRSNYFMNDHNLQTVLATKGRSQEVCITQENKLLLYLEPEVSEFLGYQKINFLYDMVALDKSEEDAIIEDCRPCNPREVIRAYCSSDFVVVGRMDEVFHMEETTHISVAVSQIIREIGSHFSRPHRQSNELQGIITMSRKCDTVKGEGMFLMTGRERLGELRMKCAPHFHEWESIVDQAEREGWMECTRD